jgi:integrase
MLELLRKLDLHARAAVHAVTLAEAADAWLDDVEHRRKRKATTVRDYRMLVRSKLLPALGADTLVADLTVAHVEAMRDARLAAGASPRTACKDLIAVGSILNFAHKRGWVIDNVAGLVDKPGHGAEHDSGDFTALEPTQVFAVAAATDPDAYGRMLAAAIVVSVFTGLRQGELRALRWRDVDFALGLVHVRRNLPSGGDGETTPKGKKVRSVPLIDQAAAALDGLSRREHVTSGADFVFANDLGGPLDADRLRRRFIAGVKAAGLGHLRDSARRPLRWHDLRHTFGTLAVQAWPLTDVQAYMGHADIKTTMIYVHHMPRTDAAKRLGALVTAQTTPAPVDIAA